MTDIIEPIDPTEIARRALRDIVDQKLPPTPENYVRAYRNAAGSPFDVTLAPTPSVGTGMPEAAAIIQSIVDTVMQTTRNLSDGVSAWDKESERILEGADPEGKPDMARVLRLILESTLSLKQTVHKSHQELAETRARLDVMSKDLARFENLASTDPLTGLCNRRAMEESMQREIARAKRAKESLSIAILDIDHFKQINDRHGHGVGDQALVHVATIMKSGIREMDLVCRYGGEEFVVVLPNTGAQGAHFVIDRLRLKIQNTSLSAEHTKVALCVSAGVAELQGDELLADFLSRADKALYHAKQNGRNQVALA